MESSEKDTNSTSPEPNAKRRKLRKGTTSCWDCKKRKVKCIVEATDTICVACRRRGAPCIRQDQPLEEYQVHAGNTPHQPFPLFQSTNGFSGAQLSAHLSHEQLLERLRAAEQLLERRNSHVALQIPELHTGPTPDYGSPTVDDGPEIIIALRKALPLQQDIDSLCKSDYTASFYCYQMTTRYTDRPEQEALEVVNGLTEIPSALSTPPVLLAKRMLILALILQYFRCIPSNRLSENPATLAHRLVDSAVRHVTTNDQLVVCVDGLECIIFEAMFQSNGGNLRRAWMAFRRAMVIAQLMKLDLLNSTTSTSLQAARQLNPRVIWFRIAHMDSYLSLMLGLPHGGQATNMETPIPGETHSCKIERAQTLIARSIIDRNRRDPLYQDINATRDLDRMLLNIAKELPDKYWLPPNFTNIQPNTKEAFMEITRLRDQLHHYNLVHLLHLPFLLQSGKASEYHMYSKITCINASREILTRFIAFRNFHRSITQFCRTSDFFALMAGMTILLAHIDSHRWRDDEFCAHQRLGDRAMVEHLLESMESNAQQTSDVIASKSAEQLRCLLETESDAARGMDHATADIAVNRLEERCGEQLHLAIPYFGIVKIGVGGITKDGSMAQDVFTGFDQSLLAVPVEQQSQPQLVALTSPTGHFPGLAAGVDDWAFQGVDAAFFDSLMRGAGDWEGDVVRT